MGLCLWARLGHYDDVLQWVSSSEQDRCFEHGQLPASDAVLLYKERTFSLCFLWRQAMILTHFIRWPLVKRFALCYRTVVCLSCPVCPVCNGWTDQDETWHAGRPRHWPHCVRWEPRTPSPEGAQPTPNFRPISVVAMWLDGSRCHLVWR